MRMRRLLVVAGPFVGLVGLGHLVDGRRLAFFLSSSAGWLLLLDAARSIEVALDGGSERFAAAGAALSSWLYMMLACLVARRTWNPGPADASPTALASASAQ